MDDTNTGMFQGGHQSVTSEALDPTSRHTHQDRDCPNDWEPGTPQRGRSTSEVCHLDSSPETIITDASSLDRFKSANTSTSTLGCLVAKRSPSLEGSKQETEGVLTLEYPFVCLQCELKGFKYGKSDRACGSLQPCHRCIRSGCGGTCLPQVQRVTIGADTKEDGREGTLVRLDADNESAWTAKLALKERVCGLHLPNETQAYTNHVCTAALRSPSGARTTSASSPKSRRTQSAPPLLGMDCKPRTQSRHCERWWFATQPQVQARPWIDASLLYSPDKEAELSLLVEQG